MAKLVMAADVLMDQIMERPNFVTLNGVTFDPVLRKVTFEIVGADVPKSEFVELDLNFGTREWKLVPANTPST